RLLRQWSAPLCPFPGRWPPALEARLAGVCHRLVAAAHSPGAAGLSGAAAKAPAADRVRWSGPRHSAREPAAALPVRSPGPRRQGWSVDPAAGFWTFPGWWAYTILSGYAGCNGWGECMGCPGSAKCIEKTELTMT